MENELAFKDALPFMLGGKAYIIFYSDTGRSFRYRVKKIDMNRYFVYKADHIGIFTKAYIGGIWRPSMTFTQSKPDLSPDPEMEESKKIFKWVFDRLVNNINKLPSTLHILHNGTCSHCGRPLTDPESVRLGQGPKCRGAK